MAQAPTFSIEERNVVGARVVRLNGRALPYQGVGFGQQMRGAQHQIIGGAVERAGERTADAEADLVGRGEAEHIAGAGEDDQAVEQVVAVVAPAGDVKVEIELCRGGDPQARRLVGVSSRHRRWARAAVRARSCR